MNNGCRLCAHGVGMEEGRTHVDVGEEYGVNEASVRRHRRHLRDAGAETDLREASASSMPGDSFFGSVPEQYITARGASVRDPETGSWYKASWKPNAVALHEALAYDDLSEILDKPIIGFYDLDKPREHAEVFDMADLQIGKASQRGGGTKETVATVQAAAAEFIAKVKVTCPQTILLVDGGDPIEGIFNVKGQKYTNDLDYVAQIRTCRRLFAEVIRAVAPWAPEIVFLSVPSNHGAARDGEGRDSQAGTVDADFGLDINYSLEENFADRDAYKHVRFVRPESLEETATISVAGTRLAFHHGHQSGGIHKHSDWWAKQSHGRRPGWDADILVMHHWHTPNLGQSGNGRWVISATASEPGSDWYTNKTGESSVKGVTGFSVKDGKWFDYTIYGMRAPA